MLVGTLRCGSGITGVGGADRVVAVVSGGFCSDALIWKLRALGAGFGIGTVGAAGAADGVENSCAEDGAARHAAAIAVSNASAACLQRAANCTVIRTFRFLFNLSSRPVIGPFILFSATAGI